MEDVILLLGSNKGDRLANLSNAIQELRTLAGSSVILSSLYESEPWGFESEKWFLNMAVKFSIDINPKDLLKSVLDIEKRLGRIRRPDSSGYESREIDIDIIFFGDKVIQTTELTIPHPKMHLRKFVLAPVSEICPGYFHPLLGKSIIEMLDNCEDNAVVIKSCRKTDK